MTVYVIVVTFNGIVWIDKCLKSISKSTIPLKTIVVDNASTDGTQVYVKKKFPDILFIQNTNNLGFGKANNLGIEYAIKSGADFVYLLNQDAWIEDDTIAEMLKVHYAYPEYGILSPMQYNANMQLDTAFSHNCKISGLFLGNSELTKPVCDINFVMAAHWLISRECVLTVGGFAPIFQHYGEDNNYIYRAVYHNFKIGICTKAIAVHDRETRNSTSKERALKSVYVSFLVKATNILLPQRRIFNAYGNLFWIVIKYIIKFKSFEPLRITIMAFSSLKEIIKMRKDCKAKICIYLNILAFS